MNEFAVYDSDLANLISNADIVGVVNNCSMTTDEQLKHISEENLADIISCCFGVSESSHNILEALSMLHMGYANNDVITYLKPNEFLKFASEITSLLGSVNNCLTYLLSSSYHLQNAKNASLSN